jgi:predicted enzyme related to lactoylglutathione lyase
MTVAMRSVAVFVTDVERARIFYEDQLGLPVHTAGSFGFEFFDQSPHLGVHPAAHPDSRALVGRHTGVTLQVDGLLNLCSTLGEHGVRFVAEPTQQEFGIMALVADPDGNILALWEDNTHAGEEPQ